MNFSSRRAVLQKWREKYGPKATYKNLAKGLYNAGKSSLVQTVCNTMTQSYSTELSQPFTVLDEQTSELLGQIVELLENPTSIRPRPIATSHSHRQWCRAAFRKYRPRTKPTSSAYMSQRVATFCAYRSGQAATSHACRPWPTATSSADSPQAAATSHACRPWPTATSSADSPQAAATSHACRPMPTATSSADSPQAAATSCAYSLQPAAMTHAYKWVATFIALLIVLWVSSYLSQNNNSLNWKSFPAPSAIANTDPLSTELGEHKTTQVAPNNLPYFAGPFVGRDDDVRNITYLLFHSLAKMVHIYGLPAVGKSTLAVHVGHKMVSRGVAVRYINMDDSHISKSSYISEPVQTVDNDWKTSKELVVSSNITLSWYSPSQKEFVSATTQALIEWAKGLSNITLLILDNCDLLLKINTERENSFLRVLDALSKASPYLHTVTTSRLKLNLLDAKPYKLKPLDSEFAIELLQLFAPIVTLNDSRMINELVDGIPLALKIVGSLVSITRPPNLIIKELQQNLIQTLTPEDIRPETQKLRPVLRLSFNYLHSDTQECALYLSHFPGSFSQEAALHILSNCTNSTSTGCMRNLTDSSLLDLYFYAGQNRYQFHKLIKEFLIDIKYHDNQILDASMIRFNSSFVLYYAQLLHNFITFYNQMPYDDENIGRFEYESHNFDCLMQKVYSFNAWKVKSVVHFTHALNSGLMLEIFTVNQLLKAGQSVLVLFEGRMDDISMQIGVLETMNVYRDLVLVLREWIQSFPNKDCKSLCEETFLQQRFAIRVETINRQCAKINCNRQDYYRKLQFSYFGESVCFSYCLQFSSINISTLIICSIVMLVITMVKVIIRRRLTIKQIVYLLVAVLCLCFGRFFHVYSAISLSVAIDVAYHFPVLNRFKHKNFKIFIAVLYFALFFVLMLFAFRENLIMTNFFLYFYMIAQCLRLFCTKLCFRKCIYILHVFSLLFVFHSCIYEIEYLHYASSYILAFMYPPLYVWTILQYQVVVTCMKFAVFDI